MENRGFAIFDEIYYSMLPCYKSVKIVLDKIMALMMILVLSPVLLLISILLWFMGSDAIFIQSRIGLLGNSFSLYKFKTMLDAEKITEKDRITPLGNFLRRSSLDELPQLWNILKGDMSFIGPRPLLEEYLPLYSEAHQKRHWVMPGVTGLAQVNGRNNLSWQEKFDQDVYYQENISLWLDIKILFLTFKYFLKGSEGNHPASKFVGYNN